MADPERVRLVVLFGGRSAEHEVSCTTATHVLQAADRQRYQLVPVGITRDGDWVLADDALAARRDGVRALPSQLQATGTAVEPLPTVLPASADVPVVVLPLLHGPMGEDGTVQGMLELAGVPYVGAGVLSSALCMDKAKAKEVAAAHGIPQARWAARRDTELDDAALTSIVAELGLPLFVKPANLGSSVGVTKVTDADMVRAAADLAASYDEWIVFEEGIAGREIEVAVLGNAEPRASVPGEVVPSHDFYDYDDKYLDDGVQLLIPAPIPDELAEHARALALRAFAAMRCDGMARVDMFYEEARSGGMAGQGGEDGRGLLLNEVNTIPGFTPGSMYPKLWEASGVPYSDLIDELVRLALERHEHRSRFSTKR